MPLHAVAQDACQMVPAQHALDGVRCYADEASSIVDTEKRRQHEQAMKPLYDLMRIVSNAADGSFEKASIGGVPSCALANLNAWAEAGALLARPTWSVPLAEQTIAVTGLNLAALKLKLAGQTIPQNVMVWLSKATDTIVATYNANTQRANLYAWSGVAAASYDLLSGGHHFGAYHDRVWRESVSKIRADGYVDGELSRRGRALIYHNYLRGALALLNRLRRRLGHTASRDELATLTRLGAMVNANACDPKPITELAGAQQEALGRWETSIGTYFARANQDELWRRCTRTPAGFSGPTYGGRFDLTSRAVDLVPAR